MPALLMDNVPPEIYELLQRRADARRRSVQDEAVDLLQRSLRREGFGRRPATAGPGFCRGNRAAV